MSKYFYSCDWGTTNLRLKLVEASSGNIVSSIETDQGIAKVFSQWQTSTVDRFNFYCRILQQSISELRSPIEDSTEEIPLIISGMASSSIGMIELRYAEVPVCIDGSGLFIQTFKTSTDFPYPIILISGVRTNTDLMRGEEVQVIGACHNRANVDELFILPGTHSKHIWIHDNNITGIKTHMTGELFQLLAVKSILSNSIEVTADLAAGWESFFEEGVIESVKTGVLENLFGLRIAQLFNKRTAQQNLYYLNGLLIGNELKNITEDKKTGIVLVSNEHQKKYYSAALNLLNVTIKRLMSTEVATVTGHQILFEKYLTGNL